MGAIATTVSTLSELVQMVKGLKLQAVSSLTKYSKDANIIGRVYIEDNIAHDDVAVPLMGTLNQMYIGYILTALNLDRMVAGGRTVRETIGVVASEGYTHVANIIEAAFGKENLDIPIPSMEDTMAKIEDESQRLICGRLIELDMMGSYSVGNTESDITVETKNGKQEQTVTPTKTTLEGKLETFKAYIYVQLIPYIIDTATATNFFEFNFVPGFMRRWRQLRAGEIKFFRDFIFAKDLIEKQKAGIKKDKSGVLVEMMMRQRSSLFKWASQLIGIAPENHNAASSMCVISKQSFDAACAASHVNFSSSSDRERFFTKTFTMFVVVVDTMYGSVDLYINGINVVGKYTFDMINKVGTKGKDSFDLKQIMQSLNQGMTPKF